VTEQTIVAAAMGGGNGLKSHMAQQKKQAKIEAEKKGGGGSAGIAARTASSGAINCAVCRAPFTAAKMKAQLREHWESKHAGKSFAECFPGVEL